MTPNGSVVWSTFQTSGAPQGVYTVWIQGHSSDPVLLDHYYPVGIAIGSVNRDFSTSSGATDRARDDRLDRHRHAHGRHDQQQRHLLRRGSSR